MKSTDIQVCMSSSSTSVHTSAQHDICQMLHISIHDHPYRITLLLTDHSLSLIDLTDSCIIEQYLCPFILEFFYIRSNEIHSLCTHYATCLPYKNILKVLTFCQRIFWLSSTQIVVGASLLVEGRGELYEMIYHFKRSTKNLR